MTRPLTTLALAIVAVLAVCVSADIYMNNPDGLNCGRITDDFDNNNSDNRQNGNRLCNSENGADGGTVSGGVKPTYKAGSITTIMFTAQHGCSNKNVRCNVVIQMITKRDNPLLQVTEETGSERATYDASQWTGTNANQNNNNNADTTASRQGTLFLGAAASVETAQRSNLPSRSTHAVAGSGTPNNLRGGMREKLSDYVDCVYRERNKGLWQSGPNTVANLARDNEGYATASVQNQNSNQFGLECMEERTIYPYPHCTPFRDLVVMVGHESNVTNLCPYYQAQSQNTRRKGQCSLVYANNESKCNEIGGTWSEVSCLDEDIEPPACILAEQSRDNHLGNVVGENSKDIQANYNWTLPEGKEEKAVIRIRYNITTGDYDGHGEKRVDYRNSGDGSPIKQDRKHTLGSYNGHDIRLQINMNENQFHRVFEDSSDEFYIEDDDANACPGGVIHNLNVRGRRGNLAQAFRAEEYKWTARETQIDLCDCVHLQWTGSTSYNTDPEDCDIYGTDNAGRGQNCDKSNVVETSTDAAEVPLTTDQWRMVPQDVEDRDRVIWRMATGCTDEERDVQVNVDSGEGTCDIGTFQYCDRERMTFHSSRNNDFSNRSQKGGIEVGARNWLIEIAIAIAITLFGIALIAAGAAFYAKKNPNSSVARLFQNGGNRGSGIMNSPRYGK
jgi:hypothetical protein